MYRNRFHCFGCGDAGNVIDFVKKIYNLNFREAIKYLVGNIAVGKKEMEIE